MGDEKPQPEPHTVLPPFEPRRRGEIVYDGDWIEVEELDDGEPDDS